MGGCAVESVCLFRQYGIRAPNDYPDNRSIPYRKDGFAQRMLEKYKYPYLSIDHLKMGLIRSGNTSLTPEDDDALTAYLWPIVREMMKTAIENRQNLIVEGCYVPFDWRKDFDAGYASSIRFICLAMTGRYIGEHFSAILGNASTIESRLDDECSISGMKEDNQHCLEGFARAGFRTRSLTYIYLFGRI